MEELTRLTLPARLKLKSGDDFRRAYDFKCSSADGRLIVYAVANELHHHRFGVSVSKKVGNAVARNRVKRMLREAFRLSQNDIPHKFDYVLIPRNEPLGLSIDEWRASLLKLANAAHAKALSRRSA